MLQGKEIILGVCGGIAAYKAAELTRLYIKANANVHVVMTRAAQEFITPLTFQTLSGNPVHTDLFNLYQESEISHISLAERADICVVAPATANVIGKLAGGIADDLLTTTLMATRAPILLAPAMNVNMWENSICTDNRQRLQNNGYRILDPISGMLACGWEGKGKLPEPAAIFAKTLELLTPNDLAGRTVLISAGPTREEIDPVRFISNYSSGKMGYAIAAAACQRGARTILVSGPTCLPQPHGVERIDVTSAQQMRTAMLNHAPQADIIIKAAAVADYRPATRADQKIKKSDDLDMILALEKTPDILAEIGEDKGRAILVGFAAETENLLDNAAAKLEQKNLDLIVANDISQEGAGFDGDTNIVRLLYRGGRIEELPLMTKEAVANQLLDRILGLTL
ncbi:MAG: bifunctional phosphopantothenoylcysteine decarboxylase/phosphopantothenate--cysteine ligase CoaBC [Desulfuromonadales bacterium]|nr:bifunctional phosphopantothenoylcysteine decarboxylase/phosphopantothenate--cysteine ligase CoaBC [Desulfuromonadales bacterium]MDT8423867.1 bifunctional phosphopantothenoylcysteine decarboxylase/phosphopantothenate--cysteine ligase CoaBC [Desulfuromonadales bacterium]